MRDVKRIYQIVNLLEDVWLLNPDLRFGQIVELMFKALKEENVDPFYVEDEKFAEILKVLLEIEDFEAYGETN